MPRFHLDKSMGRSAKDRQQEKREKILKKRKQRGIDSFLDKDQKYGSTTDRIERQNEEFGKIIKKPGSGINNCRADRNK